MSQARPTISVLLPFYNSGQYLAAAISSILQQTFNDFELLLLDDGSTDNPEKLLSAFTDMRIRHLRSQRNLGLSRQLNLGLAAARGAYIARMDADDIAELDRFEKQYLFMREHSEIGICGSQAQLFDQDGDREIWEYPTAPEEVHATLFFKCPFLHPGVLMRAKIFEEEPSLRYDETLIVAQDYMLWHELLKHTKGANLAECLTRYRVSAGQLTRAKSEVKADETRRVRLRMLQDLGLEPTEAQQTLHSLVLGDNWEQTPKFFESASRWLEILHQANDKSALFPRYAFARMLAKHFFFQCQCATRRSFNGKRFYANLSFSDHYSPRFLESIRINAKSLIKV